MEDKQLKIELEALTDLVGGAILNLHTLAAMWQANIEGRDLSDPNIRSAAMLRASEVALSEVRSTSEENPLASYAAKLLKEFEEHVRALGGDPNAPPKKLLDTKPRK